MKDNKSKIVEIIDSLNSVASLNRHLNKLTRKEKVEFLYGFYHLVEGISINSLYHRYLRYHYLVNVKKQEDVDFFAEMKTFHGTVMNFGEEEIYLRLKEPELMNLQDRLIPNLIKECESGNPNLITNTTFTTGLNNSQLERLHGGLIAYKPAFIHQDTELRYFIKVFNGNRKHKPISPIKWVFPNPRRKDQSSTPTLLSFLKILSEFGYLNSEYLLRRRWR